MDLPVNYDEMDRKQRRVVREEYIRIQDGKCCHCGALLAGRPSSEIQTASVDESLFPPRFFEWPIHLHHCHDSGMTIGAVHARCNAVLWQYHGE